MVDWAYAASEMEGRDWSNIVTIVLTIVIFYFLMIRSQQKKAKDQDMSISAQGDVTRYLASSAMLLGSSFRRQWLDYVKEKHKALAPEFGVDVPTLIKLCKYFEDRETKYYVSFFIISLFVLFVYLIFTIDSYATFLVFLVIAWIIVWIIQVHKDNVEKTWAMTFFQRNNYNPEVISSEFNSTIDKEISSILNQNDYNLIIYSGFEPFVGAGINLGGWSFSVDISQPKHDLGVKAEVLPFAIKDLYADFDGSLSELSIEGLKIQDALFVNGKTIRNEKWILPDIYGRPINRVDEKTIERFIENNDPSIRHYRWIQIFDWSDQMVVSYFLRCLRQGKSLFVDTNILLLTPIANYYCGIDSLVPPELSERIQSGVVYLVKTPFIVLYSWLALLAKSTEMIADFLGTNEKQIRKVIKNTPLFDYGAENSLRSKMSSLQYSHFFQRSDKEMYGKIIDRTLLDSIVKFLDDHNIDTSDLKERQTTIMNSGIIVQGGDVKAQAMAVGTASQATTSTRLFAKSRGQST